MRLDDTPQNVLTLDTVEQDHWLVVYMIGECDMETVPQLMDELSKAIHEGKNVILDVHLLTYIDSTGISAVASAQRSLAEEGRVLRIVGSHGLFAKAIQLCRLDRLVELYDTVEDARQGLNPIPLAPQEPDI